ncbi:MAG TPA: helix-turn-helix transcriptional regulator [Marinobacter sp.]|nr:helix-turn-helix transcriptional regulator [Marinobacter sp.]
MHLSTDEGFFLHQYHELLGLIYDSVNGERGFFPFLERFIEVFQGYSGSFAIYNTAENHLLGAWTINIPDAALRFYSEHVSHRDVLVQRAMSVCYNGQGRFVASNLDLGPDTQQLRSETRAEEWLSSYGASEAAGAVVYMDGDYLTFFGIQRSPEQPAFTYQELRVFDGFLPHLWRAVSLYTRLMQKPSASAIERLILDRASRGVIICDAAFRVVFRNARADELLARKVGLRVGEDGLLVTYGAGSTRQFSIVLSTAVQASVANQELADQVFNLRNLEGDGQRITLVVSPLAGIKGGSGATHGALITLYDWSQQPAVRADLLQSLFELTGAETSVALGLLDGQSIGEIAERSGRSRETVRYHLNSLFRKTGTRRQGELVALMYRCCVDG